MRCGGAGYCPDDSCLIEMLRWSRTEVAQRRHRHTTTSTTGRPKLPWCRTGVMRGNLDVADHLGWDLQAAIVPHWNGAECPTGC